MKKNILVLLLIVAVFNFCACADAVTDSIDTTENNDTTIPLPDDEVIAPDISDGVINGYLRETVHTSGLVIKEKKYETEEKDYYLLHVSNPTGQNRGVTVKMDFFDENGVLIEKAVQSYDWFAAGYEKYFLFRPYYKFDNCSYEIEVEDTDEDVPVIRVSCGRIETASFYSTMNGVEMMVPYSVIPITFEREEDTFPTTISMCSIIVLDKNGELYDICSSRCYSELGSESSWTVKSYEVFETGKGISSFDSFDRQNTYLTLVPIITHADIHEYGHYDEYYGK